VSPACALETNILTDAAVRRYKPDGTRRLIKDSTEALYLVIQPSGKKSWMMRFRRAGGRPAKIVLGPVHSANEPPSNPTIDSIGTPLTLAGARVVAAEVHLRRNRGEDVIADLKAQRHRQRTAVEDRAANTFGALVRRFAAEYTVARWNTRPRRFRYTLALLGFKDGEPIKDGLMQRWATKSAREIDGHAIWQVVDEARRIGVPGMRVKRRGISEARARDLHSALGSLFKWLHEQRAVDLNPTAGVSRPRHGEPSDRVLTTDEIVKFWKATDEVGGPQGAILKMLLLTGQRRSEIAGLRWDEVRDDVIDLPSDRVKNHRRHLIPLAPAALALIEAAPRIEGCPFVFSNGRTSVNSWGKIKRELDAAMGDPPPWTIHQLRHTVSTRMNELGIAPHVVELILNHASGHRRGVAGRYNHSELLPERRKALTRWAAHLSGIVSRRPSNVTDLKSRRARL
jgi:integrase